MLLKNFFTYTLFFSALFNSFAVTVDEVMSSALISNRKGEVQLSHGNRPFKSVQMGSLITIQDQIRTGRDALALIRFADGGQIRMGQQTKIIFKNLATSLNRHYFGSNNLNLTSGNVWLDFLDHQGGSIFDITIGKILLRSRRALFYVSIEKNDIWLAVKQGAVEVKNISTMQSDVILAGEGIVLQNKETFTQPQRYVWANNINWDKAKWKEINFNEKEAKRIKEFQEKKRKWVKNETRWNEFRKKWDNEKVAFEKKRKKILDSGISNKNFKFKQNWINKSEQFEEKLIDPDERQLILDEKRKYFLRKELIRKKNNGYENTSGNN